MPVFAIGDLHLPGHDEKPMDVFGHRWERHFELVCENWTRLVQADDIVLIPGDISWAMQLSDALDDLNAIAALPGRKVLLRGNHDYWWSSISRLREHLPQGMYALQNDAMLLDDIVICGTRGWTIPTAAWEGKDTDVKIYQRELIRLRLSLQQGQKLADGRPLVCMMHFPPVLGDLSPTGFSELLEEYAAHTVVYGHLHGAAIANGFGGMLRGVRYELVSCDALSCVPKRLVSLENDNY